MCHTNFYLPCLNPLASLCLLSFTPSYLSPLLSRSLFLPLPLLSPNFNILPPNKQHYYPTSHLPILLASLTPFKLLSPEDGVDILCGYVIRLGE